MRGVVRAGLPGYLGSLSIVTGLLLAPVLWTLARLGIGDGTLWALGLMGFLPASEAALTLVNHFVTTRIGPRALPGLELRDGVPARLRTLVVVPTLLTSRVEIEAQIERLEIHALASPDDDLRFALLSDWGDADVEYVPGDDELLAAATDGHRPAEPRAHGPGPAGPRFLLLHRRRVWNAGEGAGSAGSASAASCTSSTAWLRGATDTTFLPPPRHGAHGRPGERPLRDHPRCRHAAAAAARRGGWSARWRTR
jgi:cyclic beta-1,2-glucan synthetase